MLISREKVPLGIQKLLRKPLPILITLVQNETKDEDIFKFIVVFAQEPPLSRCIIRLTIKTVLGLSGNDRTRFKRHQQNRQILMINHFIIVLLKGNHVEVEFVE